MPTETAAAGAPQLEVELRGVGKSFGGTPALRDIDLDHQTRRGARSRRRERRRQVDARQDHRRALHRRRGNSRRERRRGELRLAPRGARSRDRRDRSGARARPGAQRRRERLPRPGAADASASSTAGGCARRFVALAEQARVRPRSGSRSSASMRLADQQKVEILRALARGASVIVMDEPTARSVGDRHRPAARRRPPAGGIRSHCRARLALPRRGARALRHGHDPARRPPHPHRSGRRRDRGEPDRGDARTHARLGVPRQVPGAGRRRRGARRPRPRRGRGQRRLVLGRAPARSSESPASSAPGAARSRTPSSAPLAARAATSSVAGRELPRVGDRRRAARRCLPHPGVAQGAGPGHAARGPRERDAVEPRRAGPRRLDPHDGRAPGGPGGARRGRRWRATSVAASRRSRAATSRRCCSPAPCSAPRKVLIADEPTRGVDVGSRRSIYDLIVAQAQQGIGVVVISSEVEEVLGLAHRILVIREAAIVGEFAGDGDDGREHPDRGVRGPDHERGTHEQRAPAPADDRGRHLVRTSGVASRGDRSRSCSRSSRSSSRSRSAAPRSSPSRTSATCSTGRAAS